MHDDFVSRAAVIATTLWCLAIALVALTWGCALRGVPIRYEGAIGLTAMLSLTVAACWQIRMWFTRLCALIRVGSGLQSPDAEFYTIKRREQSHV